MNEFDKVENLSDFTKRCLKKNGSYICGCSGRIGIFFYDCGSVIEEFIEGKYQVYSDDGRVIFVQYD